MLEDCTELWRVLMKNPVNLSKTLPVESLSNDNFGLLEDLDVMVVVVRIRYCAMQCKAT